MPSRKQWVFSPDIGGIKIPERVQRDVQQRLAAVAAERFAGKYTRLDIRFKAQFCYIDAYTEPPNRQKAGRPKTGPRRAKNTLSGCATRPRISAACATSAMIVGAGRSTLTAMRSTNSLIFPTARPLASQKTPF
jgi:hypothetical protein